MPPRRSTRSRASVEPVEPQIKRESVVPKRKRSQVIEVEDTSLEEQEEVKPAIRTRRASSAKASAAPTVKPRAPSRSRKATRQVQESDEEPDPDSPPPLKKSRPSTDLEDLQEEDEEEEDVKPAVRSRARASSKAAAPKKGRGAKSTVYEVLSSGDEVVVEKPPVSNGRKPPSRRSSAAPAASSTSSRGRRPTKSASRSVKVEPIEEATIPSPAEGSDDDLYINPPSPSKSQRVPSQSLDQQPSLEENESMEERPAKSTPKRGKRRTKAAVAVSDIDDDDGLPVVEKRKPLLSTPSPTKARLFAPTIDEDETSLLDLPNLSPTKPSAPPIPEAPKGPKARLVIHKMALVNFKSYAGRQEIGPFHKVCLPVCSK